MRALLATATVLSGTAAQTLATSAGVTAYFSACNYFPPVDPVVALLPAHAIELHAQIATVSVTTGRLDGDALEVDPDLTQLCSFWERSCGPCPGLNVTASDDSATLTIAGTATPLAFQECLRRVHYRSIFPGPAPVGDRTVAFTHRTLDTGVASTASKRIAVISPDEGACSAALTFRSPLVELGAAPGTYPLAYNGGCVGVCPGYSVFIVPNVTISLPRTGTSAAAIPAVRLFFDLFTRGEPPVYVPSQDRLAILPAAGATGSEPCPGVEVTRLPDDSLLLWGPATAADLTACVRRAIYYNNATGPADVVPGRRPPTVRAYSPITSYSEGFMSVQAAVNVTLGACPVCPAAAAFASASVFGEVGGIPSEEWHNIAGYTRVVATSPGDAPSLSAATVWATACLLVIAVVFQQPAAWPRASASHPERTRGTKRAAVVAPAGAAAHDAAPTAVAAQ